MQDDPNLPADAFVKDECGPITRPGGGWPFWVAVGVLSGYWAEVTCGSSPLIFASPWGLIVTLPLYSVHLWAIGGAALRRGRNQLICLYLAGTVFGLYEAYITKVLWAPPWNAHPIRFGGVALLEFLLLVFFWHPVMAFVIPVLTAERWLTRSRTLYNQLPRRVRALAESRRARPWLGAALGAVHGLVTPPISIVFSLASIWIAVFGAAALWRKGGVPANEVSELMPRGTVATILWVIIVAFYLFCGPRMRPEGLPGLGPQVTIWICYAVLIALTFASFRRARQNPPAQKMGVYVPSGPDKRFIIPLVVTALLVSLLRFFVPNIGLIFVVALWVVSIPTGCAFIYLAARWALARGEV